MSKITRFQYEQMLTRLSQQHPERIPPARNDAPAEKKLHEKIIEYCDAQWPRWKYVHSRMDKPTGNEFGVPDFVIALPHGRTIYVEAKRPGKKLSPAQRNWKHELELLGHRLHVVYDFNDFLGQLGPYLSNPSNKTQTIKK